MFVGQRRSLATAGAPPRLPLRLAVWLVHMALPLLGLWLLVAAPFADLRWENDAAHFWLVAATASINLALAAGMNAEARRREDARLFLVSMAFASAAGFLALHALATPSVLLGRNTGFVIATPVGLTLAAVFAAASSLEMSPASAAAVLRVRRAVRSGLVALLLAWAALTLGRFPPFDVLASLDEQHAMLLGFMAAGAALYVLAAVRYWRLYRRRPSVMLLSLVTAFVVLAEALVSVAYGRSWHVSWWEWHALMAAGFAFVAYSAFVHWMREGSPTGLFGAIALAQTLQNLRHEYGRALEALVEVVEGNAVGDARTPVGPAAARVAERFQLTERQAEVLVEAADALAHEREQIRRQGALVAVGREASVIRAESDLLERVMSVVGAAFGRDRLRVDLLRDGRLDAAAGAAARRAVDAMQVAEDSDGAGGAVMALPLMVKGRPAGVLSVRRAGPFAERDRALLASFAAQLSIAVENARLYRQLDTLFHSYMSPEVATSLLADPEQARLGGAVVEVTVLMADLRGFTPFSERSSPDRVVAMLNTHFATFVPIVLDEGGTITSFIGDALMAIFNAPARQDDHALRAARAALRAQQATGAVAAQHEGWPRFRVGIHSGPAVVGNIGAEALRNFTAIGDTVNTAARLEGQAGVGEVVVSASTLAHLGEAAVVEALGGLALKGKAAPAEAYRLVALRG
jgi:class 3 adenylate cyclase/peptidoglycan/LPS O-acetylase OafA/YrhL